ncbi:MAG: tRNA/rRNA methyltransferase [Candidatus Sumerlaeota bacterium]|nr:tRNA/rRNA methyltransferase [Candidatus Sumerlaeota bacterium]
MSDFAPLADWRLVLVSPQTPGNIGAAARVLRNFGGSDLWLVAPRCDAGAEDKAVQLATRHAQDVLASRHECATLDEALAGCHASIALTMQSSADRPVDFTGFVPAPLLASRTAGEKWALVFGREDHGLNNEECSRCTFRWSIPSNPESPSFNLAQAIAIALAGIAGCAPHGEGADEEAPATQDEVDGLMAHVEQVLVASEYERGVPMELPLRLMRRAANRARMRTNEVRALRGVCRRVLNAILGFERRP